MIKKFDEYIKEDFHPDYEYEGDIDSVEDLDYKQMNRLPYAFKKRYKALIEYDIILPDKGDETKAIARKVIENDMRKMHNAEIAIKEIHEIRR